MATAISISERATEVMVKTELLAWPVVRKEHLFTFPSTSPRSQMLPIATMVRLRLSPIPLYASAQRTFTSHSRTSSTLDPFSPIVITIFSM